jgi:hypothetical protein
MGPISRIVALLVVVCTTAVVGMPAAAQTTRTLTVTPDSGLVDGDVVTLHGTGFTPSDTVFFCQGVEDGSPDPGDCGAGIGSAQANAAGEFDASFTVQRFISPSNVGVTIDCAQPSANCRFGASDFFSSAAGFAFAPISFAPQPPRTLSVTPDADLVDGQVVALSGTGFTPSDTVHFCQGVEGAPPGFAGCAVAMQSAQVDAAGNFSAAHTLQRFIPASLPPAMIDCAAPSVSCVMSFLAPSGFAHGRVPISFAPQAPVPQISGTVTAPDGAPVAGADVWAYTPSDGFVGSLRTVTDAQGSYEFTQVEPGAQHRILFRNPTGSSLASEWFEDEPSREAAIFIELATPAEFVEANAMLEQAGGISGSVTDASGSPLADVSVGVFGPDDTWVGTHITTTASDGTYAIANVRPSDYRVHFATPAASGLAPEWFDDAATRGLATAITVSAGDIVAGVDAQLEDAGSISGSVTDADGSPLAGVQVSAFGPDDIWVGSHSGSTAADGTYVITDVRPAAYGVRFAAPAGTGLAPEWFDDVTSRGLATAVTVSAGQTTAGIDAQLASPP